MQKLINALAILAFLGVAGIGGAGYYVFSNKDALIQDLLPIPGGLDDLDLPAPGLGGGAPGVTAIPSVPTPSF